jgi:hypothetical protein
MLPRANEHVLPGSRFRLSELAPLYIKARHGRPDLFAALRDSSDDAPVRHHQRRTPSGAETRPRMDLRKIGVSTPSRRLVSREPRPDLQAHNTPGSHLWLANSQSCRKDERTRVRSFGPEQPGPNPCCAFHAGSLRDGAQRRRSIGRHTSRPLKLLGPVRTHPHAAIGV